MNLLYNGFVPSRTDVHLEKYEHLPLDNYRMYSERKIPILLSKSTGVQIKQNYPSWINEIDRVIKTSHQVGIFSSLSKCIINCQSAIPFISFSHINLIHIWSNFRHTVHSCISTINVTWLTRIQQQSLFHVRERYIFLSWNEDFSLYHQCSPFRFYYTSWPLRKIGYSNKEICLPGEHFCFKLSLEQWNPIAMIILQIRIQEAMFYMLSARSDDILFFSFSVTQKHSVTQKQGKTKRT